MSVKAAVIKPRRRKMPAYVVIINVFFVLLSLCYILPMVLAYFVNFATPSSSRTQITLPESLN